MNCDVSGVTLNKLDSTVGHGISANFCICLLCFNLVLLSVVTSETDDDSDMKSFCK